LFGLRLSVIGLAALIVNTAVAVLPLWVAVIVAVVLVPTLTAVTVNVAVVAPARTVTEDGTVALLVDERLTVTPPAGAGVPRVIVPVEVVPPVTVVGFSETAMLATSTVRVAL